jgi:hypothetical protein
MTPVNPVLSRGAGVREQRASLDRYANGGPATRRTAKSRTIAQRHAQDA